MWKRILEILAPAQSWLYCVVPFNCTLWFKPSILCAHGFLSWTNLALLCQTPAQHGRSCRSQKFDVFNSIRTVKNVLICPSRGKSVTSSYYYSHTSEARSLKIGMHDPYLEGSKVTVQIFDILPRNWNI